MEAVGFLAVLSHIFRGILLKKQPQPSQIKPKRAASIRSNLAPSPVRRHLALIPASPVLPRRLQSGMNLQICFVNDSGSDKDSDADDSKTETSLDTPLSPMVRPRGLRNESLNSRETHVRLRASPAEQKQE